MHFPKDKFDDDQLSIMQTAIELTCTDLGIDKDDRVAREKIAAAVLSLTRAGQFDLERLRAYAKSLGPRS